MPGTAESGLVVCDKPSGWTSHQVVSRLRRRLGTRRVGHAGTLDPMATGVLVLGVERATRLLGRLALADKEYAATVRLGVATLTDDAEGEVVSAAGAAGLDLAALDQALDALRGVIDQVPSAVSAVKVDGVRSYARVRRGDEVHLAARAVTVRRLDLLAVRHADAAGVPVVDLDVHVECTSGTYVRALARDLGAALGTGGHLTALRRLRVGPFTIAEAQQPESEHLSAIDMAAVARRCFTRLTVDDALSADVRHGRRLADLALPADPTALLDPSGRFLALYRPVDGSAVAVAVFEPAGG